MQRHHNNILYLTRSLRRRRFFSHYCRFSWTEDKKKNIMTWKKFGHQCVYSCEDGQCYVIHNITAAAVK